MHRIKALVGVGLAAIIGMAALPTESQAFIEYFVAEGPGTTNSVTGLNSQDCAPAGLSCASGDVCQCVKTLGSLFGSLSGLNGGTYEFLFNVDLTHRVTNAAGNFCFPAAGKIVMTATDGSLLTADTTGSVCNGPMITLGLYDGSYGITSGSSGLFFKDSGNGTFNWSDQFATGTSDIQMMGNITDGILPTTSLKRSKGDHGLEFVWPPGGK